MARQVREAEGKDQGGLKLLRLKTLGGLSLWRGAEQVAPAGAPGLALQFLAILGVAGDRSVPGGDVVALLRPDSLPDDGRAELGALVTALPGWLGGVQPVRLEGDAFSLDPSVIVSDVRDFEFAAATGAPDQASRLYDGAFLEGVDPPAKSFDRWREREASRLAQVAKWCHDVTRRRSKVILTPGARVGPGGRYRVERELGAGAAATVYLAYDSRHDRQVAMKVLREDISETISPERFEKEIRFVAQLQHPHILPLFDSGEFGGVLYSVMPYVQGETVRERLTHAGNIPAEDAVRIAAEVADALAYAHEHGVLHRDVKPENILLADGHALIADFGIARSVHPDHAGRTTLPGVVLGTAAYMSPEQATGEPNLDGRTDVYALGAVLYEMLSGAPPFAGDTTRRTMQRRLTEAPPPLSKLGVHVPRFVDEALGRALQPRPENRSTSRELADALSAANGGTSGRPLPARRDRRRALAGGAGIVVLAGLALILSSRCAHAQTLLQRVLVAEDARGKGAEGITPIVLAAKSGDTTLRRVAIRALGRLQRPALVAEIVPKLDDRVLAIRAEAANALAQSVQGVSRRAPALDVADDAAAMTTALSALLEHLRSEADPAVAGVIARSLGRLPVADSSSAWMIEERIVSRLAITGGSSGGLGRLPPGAAHDVAEGLYAFARARRARGMPSSGALGVLRDASGYAADASVRRIGLLALAAAGALDSTVVMRASRDADPQVRRLALAGDAALSQSARDALRDRALKDAEPMVRVDAIRLARPTSRGARGVTATAGSRGGEAADCAAIVAATRDPNPHVMLAAIDALAAPCADGAGQIRVLRQVAGALPEGDAPRTSGHASWHGPAHALVSLARIDSSAAAPLLPRFSAHRRAQVREYAARAAAQLHDDVTLVRLATDTNQNVRAAAVTGLSQLRKHAADSVFVAALGAPGYQVVLAAVGALAGSAHTSAVPALLGALDRLSAERRENSHDERMAILTRLGELGATRDAPRVEPYLADFDTTVAGKAAELVTRWSGRVVAAHPVPLPIHEEPLARILATRGLQIRITMAASSGGGTFVVRLFPDEAPATVARIIRLARAHYYDGLTFHRVVANFVIQGGSPGANEVVGDGPFMRDELGLRSQNRGTLGISTRGRDTGDAQLFVNLVDNPRLDHDYTVFGEIVSGLSVVDGIIEGDEIATIQVIG